MNKESEEPRIEPYYQNQGKFLTDTLFDLGVLSESLSRDGLTRVEDLIALMFQQIADSTSRCSNFTKKYKKSGHDEGERVRHEEEMRWIARAKEAEIRVAELETRDSVSWTIEVLAFLQNLTSEKPAPGYFDRAKKLIQAAKNKFIISKGTEEVGEFLREALLRLTEGQRLFDAAVAAGIIPEPDCGPTKGPAEGVFPP